MEIQAWRGIIQDLFDESDDLYHTRLCTKDPEFLVDHTLEKFDQYDTADEFEEKTKKITDDSKESTDLHKETMDVIVYESEEKTKKITDDSKESTDLHKETMDVIVYESEEETNKITDDSKVSTDLHKETMDVNGFQVLLSQVEFAKEIFESNPDIASEFSPKHPVLKKAYMSFLLSLMEILSESPQDLSKDDLVHLKTALGSMTEAGFKLGWLEKKLKELSEKKEKEEACEARIQEIEQELKDYKQKCSDLETEFEKEKAELVAARTS